MRLALRMGRPDVDRFMREIGSSQLVEWEQFLVLESGKQARMVSPADFRKNYEKKVVKKPKR